MTANSNKYRTVFFIFLTLVVLFVSTITPVDRSIPEDNTYFTSMMHRLDRFRPDTTKIHGDTLSVGWAESSILPDPSWEIPLSGYGLRRDKYQNIADTIFAKVFVVDNGITKVVFINLDLLIFPPKIASLLKERLAKEKGLRPEQLYFSATHTHTAPGGWAESLGVKILSGSYREKYVQFICNAVSDAVDRADNNRLKSTIAYEETTMNGFVCNRIGLAGNTVDSTLRSITFKRVDGSEGMLWTFSAHPICRGLGDTNLSSDYTGPFNHYIRKNTSVDFVAYFSGMVGSHIPEIKGFDNNHYADDFGTKLAQNYIKKSNQEKTFFTTTDLFATRIPLDLREPHLKVSRDWRIRPWLFHLLYENQTPDLSLVKLGNCLLIGTPCDFSGELMPQFEKDCQKNNLKLIITSFNGAYIGYINNDAYYDVDREETRRTNLYGPYNAFYFTHIIKKLINKF